MRIGLPSLRLLKWTHEGSIAPYLFIERVSKVLSRPRVLLSLPGLQKSYITTASYVPNQMPYSDEGTKSYVIYKRYVMYKRNVIYKRYVIYLQKKMKRERLRKSFRRKLPLTIFMKGRPG